MILRDLEYVLIFDGQSKIKKAGFVGIIGRPNTGKSSLLNQLVGQNLALVSHKANATRNKMYMIVPYTTRTEIECQMVFVDTPGIHKAQKLLDQFMFQVALRVMNECDVCVFMASVFDDVRYYEEFLTLYNNSQGPNKKVKHILVLNKTDLASPQKLLQKIKEYQVFSDYFATLVPISVKRSYNLTEFLEQIALCLPESSALFDEQDLTTHTIREISKEMIRQSLFTNLSDEIPYESDVILKDFTYTTKQKSRANKHISNRIAHITAAIYTSKESQKKIVIGKGGSTLKRIGVCARKSIEEILGEQVFLYLEVIADKEWAKNKKNLKNFGYNFDQ